MLFLVNGVKGVGQFIHQTICSNLASLLLEVDPTDPHMNFNRHHWATHGLAPRLTYAHRKGTYRLSTAWPAKDHPDWSEKLWLGLS